MAFTEAFNKAVQHAMLYEVGGFWNENHPAVARGLIDTPANKKAVGYVNDPVDRGGETKFGVAKKANPTLNITSLTWEQAKSVYFTKYWSAGKSDQLPDKIAIIHFDGCINHGVSRANKFSQEALGVVADGVIVPKTIAAANAVMKPEEIVQHIARLRRNYYEAIIRNDPTQAKYRNGWLRRINEVEAYALK